MTERATYRFGDTEIHYEVVRSRRRKKTIEITLDPIDGVQVAAPLSTSYAHISAIVEKRAPWIMRNLRSATFSPQPREFVSGESLPYLGRQVRLFVEPVDQRSATVRFDHWTFLVEAPRRAPDDERRTVIKSALTKWYRERAGHRLPDRVGRWSKATGLQPKDVLVRSQRQRWGSCAPDGTVRFNWRILMAEPALIDYVVLHELAHLHVRTHSPEFWSTVANVMPDYLVRRQRLKEVGPYLHL